MERLIGEVTHNILRVTIILGSLRSITPSQWSLVGRRYPTFISSSVSEHLLQLLHTYHISACLHLISPHFRPVTLFQLNLSSLSFSIPISTNCCVRRPNEHNNWGSDRRDRVYHILWRWRNVLLYLLGTAHDIRWAYWYVSFWKSV